MKNPRIALRTCAATASLLLALPTAQALQRGTAPGGAAYVSGGATDSELESMRAERTTHSFWLVTAAKGSGAHLADVGVRIVDTRSGQAVLEHRMDGPWLMVGLSAGRYTVEATVPKNRRGMPETQRTTVTVDRSGIKQSVLYFDTGDVTEADLAASEAARKP